MKLKIFIVTYNNDDVLKSNLDKIFESDIKNFNYEVNIINNYRVLSGFENYNVKIYNNTIRPDFSCGHLSRSWNQALINGFKKISNPDCDICILMQNDTFILNDTFLKIIKLHEKYDFIQSGAGDQFMSFTVDAVKKSGIFDERFNSIAFQEADFFLNLFLTNNRRVSINDSVHNRILNPISDKLIQYEYSLNKNAYLESPVYNYHEYNLNLFKYKWNIEPENWNELPKIIKPQIKRYIIYPYFEKEIESLKEQNYFI